MLTAKQHDLLCFIDARLRATGISPSFEEMKEALDLKSKSGVHRLISALENATSSAACPIARARWRWCACRARRRPGRKASVREGRAIGSRRPANARQ